MGDSNKIGESQLNVRGGKSQPLTQRLATFDANGLATSPTPDYADASNPDWEGSMYVKKATLTQDGDLYYRAGGAIVRLPVGAASQVLTVGSNLLPKWGAAAAGMTNPMTTAGDLISGGVAGAPQRLAVGSAGQVLTVVSGAPAWAAGGGGGSSNNEAAAAALTNAGLGGADHFPGSSLGVAWTQESAAPTVAATVAYSTLAWGDTSVTTHYSRAFVPGAGVAFRIEARMMINSANGTNAGGFGLYAKDTTTTDGTMNGMLIQVEPGGSQFQCYSVVAGAFTGRGAVGFASALNARWFYLAVARDAANNWTLYYSWDRNSWITVGTFNNAVTISKIGLRGNADGNPLRLSCDFVDVTA